MELPQLLNLHIFIEQLAPDHTSNTLVTLISDNRRAIILKSLDEVEWGENVIKEFDKEENTGDEEKEGRMPQRLGFPFPQSAQLGWTCFLWFRGS